MKLKSKDFEQTVQMCTLVWNFADPIWKMLVFMQLTSYDVQSKKRTLMPYMNGEDPDQPTQLSPIRAFFH